jgi:hypothetical protein
MKKAFIINGSNGVGKDTFVDMVTEYVGKKGINVFNISSVDRVKSAAIMLGWNEVKDNKGRAFLSDLKDLSTLNYEGPLNYMRGRFEDGEAGIYFFMLREPQEIAKFVKAIGATTVSVYRAGSEAATNHADQEAYNYEYDITIDNSGSLEDLLLQVKIFCEEEI